MMQDLAKRATDLREFMDDPHCDPQRLHKTYGQFATINRLISGWRDIYQQWLRPAMSRGVEYRLLDIGFGGGDIAVSIADWARADGFRLAVTGIEQDVRALEFVRGNRDAGRVDFRAASARALLESGERFDFVVSNAVLHHLGDGEIRSLADESAALARRLVIHNDIRRSNVAYSLFPMWAGPCFRGSFALADGMTSIRRSFTRAELQAILPPRWMVRTKFPFRLLAMHEKTA